MRPWIGLLILMFSAGAAARGPSVPSLRTCVSVAGKERTPGERDRRRLSCLNRFAPSSSLDECLRTTRRFEYSIHSEEAKKACLFGSPGKLNAKNCLKTARQLEYGENRDELLWSCIRDIPSGLDRKSCLTLAREMVFSPYRQRATSYCSAELNPR